jgi:fluoride exporter
VNVTGSAVLGALAAALARDWISPTSMAWVGTGLVGGYTTFSTFTYETVRAIEDGSIAYAALNIALSASLSFGAAAMAYVSLRPR